MMENVNGNIIIRMIEKKLFENQLQLTLERKEYTEKVMLQILQQPKMQGDVGLYIMFANDEEKKQDLGYHRLFNLWFIYYWAIYNDTWEAVENLPSQIIQEHSLLVCYLLNSKSLLPLLKEEACMRFLDQDSDWLEELKLALRKEVPEKRTKILNDMLEIVQRNPGIQGTHNLLTFETVSVFPVTEEENSISPSRKSLLETLTEDQKSLILTYHRQPRQLEKIKSLIEHNISTEWLVGTECLLYRFSEEEIVSFTEEQQMMFQVASARGCESMLCNRIEEKEHFSCSLELVYYHILWLLPLIKEDTIYLTEKGKKKISKYIEKYDLNIHSYKTKLQNRKILSIIKGNLKKQNMEPDESKVLQKNY